MFKKVFGKIFGREDSIETGAPNAKLGESGEVLDQRAMSRRSMLKALGAATIPITLGMSLAACEKTEEDVDEESLDHFFDSFDMRALDAFPEKERGKILERKAFDEQVMKKVVADRIKINSGLDIDFGALLFTESRVSKIDPNPTTSIYLNPDQNVLLALLKLKDANATITAYTSYKEATVSGDPIERFSNANFVVNGQEYEVVCDGANGSVKTGGKKVGFSFYESNNGYFSEGYDENGSIINISHDRDGNKLMVISDEKNAVKSSSYQLVDGTLGKLDNLDDLAKFSGALSSSGLLIRNAKFFDKKLLVNRDLSELLKLIKALPSNDSRCFYQVMIEVLQKSAPTDKFLHPMEIINGSHSDAKSICTMEALWSHLNGFDTSVYRIVQSIPQEQGGGGMIESYLVLAKNSKDGKTYVVTANGLVEMQKDIVAAVADDNETLKAYGSQETIKETIKI